MSDIVASLMKPYTKSSDPQEPFGTFHNQLANALNASLNQKFNAQRHVAAGTITYPGTPVVIVPFSAPVVWPVTPFMITGAELMGVTANQDEKSCLYNIFDLIGKKITLMTVWQGNPAILGCGTATVQTLHFGSYGNYCEMETSKKDTETFNADEFWEIFDKWLSMAINCCAPAVGPLVGAVGPGVFTGTMTIKLAV